jgi:hypothetical protein
LVPPKHRDPPGNFLKEHSNGKMNLYKTRALNEEANSLFDCIISDRSFAENVVNNFKRAKFYLRYLENYHCAPLRCEALYVDQIPKDSELYANIKLSLAFTSLPVTRSGLDNIKDLACKAKVYFYPIQNSRAKSEVHACAIHLSSTQIAQKGTYT